MAVKGFGIVEKPKAVVAPPTAIVEKPKAVVAPPTAVVEKPKAIVIPSVKEGGGGASSPSFPVTQEIIGASPTTGEVLVRDIETREQSWQPATKGQITEVTEAVRRVAAGERIIYPEYRPVGIKSREEAEAKAKKTGGIAYILPSGEWGVKPLIEEPKIPPEKPKLQLKPKERGFTLPPNIPRKDITYTAKGEVEYYEKAGERFYAPASTRWDLGYRTRTQYREAQAKDEPAPYVAVTTPEGKKIHITRPENIKLAKLKGEDLFLAQIDVGIILKGSVYDPKTKGYLSPAVFKAKKEFETELKASSPELYKIYRQKGIEGYNKEITRQLTEFEGELKRISPDLHKIYKEQGVDAYNKEVARLRKEITAYNARLDATMASLKPYTDDKGGVNLYRAIAAWEDKTGGVSPEDLKLVGFESKDIDNATKGVKASRETQVALPGEKFWQHRTTGKLYTDREFKKLVADYDAKVATLRKQGKAYSEEWQELGEHPSALVTLSAPSGKRLGIETTAFIIPPARAALPEATIRDISAAEWVLGGVNVALIGAAFAPGALLGSLVGKVGITGISTAGAGALGYETGKRWDELTPVQRGIGAGGTLLYSLPMMVTAARGVKITAAKPIPTVKGEIPAWKGLTVFQNPIIGRSGGQWVIGARNISLPEARLILDGYHPEAMLETKVFTNPKALTKAGFSKTQIDYIELTLKDRNLYAGKQAPFLSKEALIEPTARLDADEIDVLLRQIQKYNKQVKQVDLLYGSATIKAQLAPELRGWRNVHDWDISMTTGPEKTAAFIKETMAELKKLLGKRQYRINPKTPTLLEKKIAGKWEHIADIHSHEVSTALSGKEIPESALDATGEYSYGRMVAEPSITVKYPGVGEIDIMKLSESGVRKADTILRVRQTEIGTAFRPPERGIAQPGVPKDAADFYVILQTYEKGGILNPGTSEEWLRQWAKSMGYTEAQLVKLMPNLKKAMVEVAGETPSNLIGYRIRPASKATVATGASPTITIHTPASLGASVSASLERSISTPVSPSVALRSIASPGLLPSLAKSVPISKAISPSLKTNISTILKSVSPSIKPLPSVKPSPPVLVSIKPSPVPSPSLKVSPSPVPSAYPSPTPLPSAKPSPVPVPSAKPSPVPSPEPEIPPPILPPPEKPLPPLPRGASDKEKRKVIKDSKGAIAWRQGELRGKDVWHCIKFPYASEVDYLTVLGRKPSNTTIVTGPRSAYETIRLRYGKPPSKKVTGDIGFMDFFIEPKDGRKIGIGFTSDPKMETTGDITIGRRALPITERPTSLGRSRAPRITPKSPRLRR